MKAQQTVRFKRKIISLIPRMTSVAQCPVISNWGNSSLELDHRNQSG